MGPALSTCNSTFFSSTGTSQSHVGLQQGIARTLSAEVWTLMPSWRILGYAPAHTRTHTHMPERPQTSNSFPKAYPNPSFRNVSTLFACVNESIIIICLYLYMSIYVR